ncbi:oxidoreductase [Cobetia marina]|uniref:Oxidoreductase n=1 Tax=Cobetia marina TaxID=28258 RepID=A0ABU9GD61_COBMA
MIDQPTASALFTPFTLPCGRVLANRLIKAAMSDSLGDGTGHPCDAQMRLYERWAEGGVAAALVGEVQPDHHHAEKPGNLVLNAQSDLAAFTQLAQRGQQHGAELWLQLGHAGAMAYPPTSTPHGPSALDIPGLRCEAMSLEAIKALPAVMATTARLARDAGFGGVQVHAAHGFLLSQFLSPLFNQRTDDYGGSLDNRMRLMREVIIAVREAVGHDYPVMVKLNSSDQLEGGFEEAEALQVIAALDELPIDLIDISGGTYFPGASSASDASASGPYFVEFARRAREVTTLPLMATGGFKTLAQAEDAVAQGAVDLVGLARPLALHPSLPTLWRAGECPAPEFPRFSAPPEGGVTAWYTLRLTQLGEDREQESLGELETVLADYEARDAARAETWNAHFADCLRD